MPWYDRDLTPLIMADYLGLDVSYAKTTDWGGSSYGGHVGHAMDAIRSGRCDVALITFVGRPRTGTNATGPEFNTYQDGFEVTYDATTLSKYALAARRHMHEYGTTREQLAEIRVAASRHAQYNEHALFRDPVTVEDVIESRPIADPLHLRDCCVVQWKPGSSRPARTKSGSPSSSRRSRSRRTDGSNSDRASGCGRRGEVRAGIGRGTRRFS